MRRRDRSPAYESGPLYPPESRELVGMGGAPASGRYMLPPSIPLEAPRSRLRLAPAPRRVPSVAASSCPRPPSWERSTVARDPWQGGAPRGVPLGLGSVLGALLRLLGPDLARAPVPPSDVSIGARAPAPRCGSPSPLHRIDAGPGWPRTALARPADLTTRRSPGTYVAAAPSGFGLLGSFPNRRGEAEPALTTLLVF